MPENVIYYIFREYNNFQLKMKILKNAFFADDGKLKRKNLYTLDRDNYAK